MDQPRTGSDRGPHAGRARVEIPVHYPVSPTAGSSDRARTADCCFRRLLARLPLSLFTLRRGTNADVPGLRVGARSRNEQTWKRTSAAPRRLDSGDVYLL